MYIKQQTFKDEDTLLEYLFDFDMGEASPLVVSIMEVIEDDLSHNQAFQEYKASLKDEEELLELEHDERRYRLAEALLEKFDQFCSEQNKLFGVKGGEKEMLYQINQY